MVDNEINEVGGEEVENNQGEDSCPSFGKAWDVKSEDCQACASVYPDEHDECKEKTLAKRGKKAAAQKQEVEKIPGPEEVEVLTPPIEERAIIPPAVKPDGEKKERKKVTKNATGGLTVQQYCLKLIKDGKNEQEVKEALKQVYIAENKDEKYAKGRANAIFSWALKQAK